MRPIPSRALPLGLLCALLLAGCSDESSDGRPDGGGGAGGQSQGGAAPVGDIVGSVERYDYAFDLSDGSARSELTLAVTTAGNCYQIPSELEIWDAELGGAPVDTVERLGGELKLCGQGVEAGSDTIVSSRAAVPEQTFLGLDVGFARHGNMAGGTMSYLLSWVGGCDHFGPCDDDPARLVSFGFEVTHPAGTVVLCPGTLTPGATTTRCALETTRAPTYSGFAVAADADWIRTPLLSAAGVDLVFYEVAGGGLRAGLDSGAVSAFLEWITELLGPYPYGPELRVAGGPTAWAGFEHPGNIILRENLDQLNTAYADGLMHVLMHEIIHQWAGDRTTLASAEDFVWKEATSEYLAYVFEDEQGPPGAADATRAYWDQASLGASYYPRPTDEPAPAVEDFYGDAYGPGPMVLYLQLESLHGRAAVLGAIQDFLAEPGARGVAELEAALEAATTTDLAPYFQAWVFGSGAPAWPTFSAALDQEGDQVTVTVTQTPPMPCRLEVDVLGAIDSATAELDFDGQSGSAQVVVTLTEPATSVQIDPRHRVIDQPQGVAPPPPTSPWPALGASPGLW